MSYRLTPLLNSRSLVPSVTLKTRMTVPLSEAVASLLPLGLKATAAKLILEYIVKAFPSPLENDIFLHFIQKVL